jgi:hypothetical protein
MVTDNPRLTILCTTQIADDDSHLLSLQIVHPPCNQRTALFTKSDKQRTRPEQHRTTTVSSEQQNLQKKLWEINESANRSPCRVLNWWDWIVVVSKRTGRRNGRGVFGEKLGESGKRRQWPRGWWFLLKPLDSLNPSAPFTPTHLR